MVGRVIAAVVAPVAALAAMTDVAGRATGVIVAVLVVPAAVLAMTVADRSMAAAGCGDVGTAMTGLVRACGRCRIGGVIAAFMRRRPDITGSSTETSFC
ncbi:hypothetical protein AA0522_2415 [Gluconacetobacter liquefaciens NRIC 0522]|nr:hypothetical protein AA0522_2415 [Gluconacetobacter liquefaciens NRIC 0522]